jgi:hypothetical protein
MANAKCKDCGADLLEREKKSKRAREILLICEKGHKWQARLLDGYLHIYRTNWKGQRGEGRKVATITISPGEFMLMKKHNLKQQEVYLLGIDILRTKQ